MVTIKGVPNYNCSDVPLVFEAIDPDSQACRDTTLLTINAVNDAPRFVDQIAPVYMKNKITFIDKSHFYDHVQDVDNPVSSLVLEIEENDNITNERIGDIIRFRSAEDYIIGTDTFKVVISDGSLSDTTQLFVYVGRTIPIIDLVIIDDKIVLKWENSSDSDIRAYNIYKTTDTTEVNENDLLSTVHHPEMSFKDAFVDVDNKYFYCITFVDTSGAESDLSNFVSVSQITNVNQALLAIPDKFELSQNYPNPFNPETVIKYGLPEPCLVTINIYDIRGYMVRNLLTERKVAGNYSVIWDTKDNFGSRVASGIYFYSFKAGEFYKHRKMILMK